MTPDRSTEPMSDELLEEEEDMLITAGDLIFKESLVRLVEAMDEPTAAAFDEFLTKEPTDEEVMTFIQTRVPDAEAIVAGAVDEIQGAILESNPNE